MSVKDIDVKELKERIESGEKLVIIDVREPYEYEEYNIGAKNIPLGTIPQQIADLQEYKDEEVIVHCRSGSRSAAAKNFMMSNGFSNVRNLTGGMEAWKRENE